MIKNWINSIRQAFHDWIAWLGREIAALLKSLLAWLVDLYNAIQTAVIDIIFDVVSFFLGFLPSFGSLDTETLSEMREQVVAWNTLLPISETFSTLLFFFAWEVSKIVIAVIHYVLGWIKAVIP